MPDGEESYLDAVLRHDDRTWLLVRPRGGEEDREASIFELHVGVGAAARVQGMTLGRNEVLLGAESGQTRMIKTTLAFVRSEEQGGAVHRLRSHDLITGARLWAWTLGSNRKWRFRRIILTSYVDPRAIAIFTDFNGKSPGSSHRSGAEGNSEHPSHLQTEE